MSDISLAVLLLALAALGWYVRRGLERESGPSGLLEERPAPATDPPAAGLRLLWGHAANLALSIPLLAAPPSSIDDGHCLTVWLAGFLGPWLRWLGLTQLLYAGPLWRSLFAGKRPRAARVLLLAAGLTAAASGLAWALTLRRTAATFSLQAAAGMLGLFSGAALAWSARELRRSL